MNENSTTFSVQMKAMDLFRFKMYHMYHSLSGLFAVALAFIAILLLVVNYDKMPEQSRAIIVLIVVWFLVIDPLRFYMHSAKQVKLSPVYKKPLGYRVDENGITVFQGEEEQTLPWDKLLKVVETGKQFIVYSSRIHAFIFPKAALEGDSEALRGLLVRYAKDKNIKMKGFKKGSV